MNSQHSSRGAAGEASDAATPDGKMGGKTNILNGKIWFFILSNFRLLTEIKGN